MHSLLSLISDSDENWWRGETQLGTGLFPASFVSTNLSVDPEPCECCTVYSVCLVLRNTCPANIVYLPFTAVTIVLVVCAAQETKKKSKKGRGSKGSKGKGQNGAKVNMDKIALLLDMIKEADVTSEENLAENETLVELEGGHLLEHSDR